MAKDLNPVELDFLLRFPATPNLTTPVDFLSNTGWGGIKVCFRTMFFCLSPHFSDHTNILSVRPSRSFLLGRVYLPIYRNLKEYISLNIVNEF